MKHSDAFRLSTVCRASHSNMSQSVFVNPSRHSLPPPPLLYPLILLSPALSRWLHLLILWCDAVSPHSNSGFRLPTAALNPPQADLSHVRLWAAGLLMFPLTGQSRIGLWMVMLRRLTQADAFMPTNKWSGGCEFFGERWCCLQCTRQNNKDKSQSRSDL